MSDSRIDWQYLFIDTRARVYLLWTVLATVGFIATHYFQRKQINGVWAAISVIGLYYMYRVMPLKVTQMKRIFYAWLVPIVFGMAVSGLVFYMNSDISAYLISRLGGFWLIVMAAAYALNGWFDRPAGWYYFAAALNMIAGLAVLLSDVFITTQYMLAAIISFWSMIYLWLYRADYS